MNIQTNQPASRLTAAETALVDAFAAQIGELPGNGAVTGTRDRLLDDLKKAGLPTRRIESWHYTDLKNLLRAVPDRVAGTAIDPVAALVKGATVLSILQGQADATSSIDGVTISAFRDQLTDGSAVAGLTALDKDDAIGRLNGSFVRDGLALAIAAGAEIDAPIELQALHGEGQIHTRFPVSFGVGSKATIIRQRMALHSCLPSVTSRWKTAPRSPGSFCSSRVPPIRIWRRFASSSAQTPSSAFTSSMPAASWYARNFVSKFRARAPN
jgi:Fe-S cluster assembly protein SufD